MHTWRISMIAALAALLAGCEGTDKEALRAALERAENLLTQIETELANARELLGETGGGTPETEFDASQLLSFPFTFQNRSDRMLAGVDQGAEAFDYPVVGHRGEFQIRYGRSNSGVGAESLKSYLEAGIERRGGGVVSRFASPPVIRIIGAEADEADVARINRAIRLVNTALPADYQLRVSERAPGVSFSSLLHWRTRNETPADTIDIQVVPDSRFTPWAGNTAVRHPFVFGLTTTTNYAVIEKAYVQLNGDNYIRQGDDMAIGVVAHELIHALGLLGHVSADELGVFSIMDRGHGSLTGEYLFPVDREALRARYGRLSVGDTPDDLGYWASSALHIHGNGQHAGFGVARRNGYMEPWAYGPAPGTDLASNSTLSGSATWNGTILGFAPGDAAVAGDAEIGVNLHSSAIAANGGIPFGTASFTNLETWTAGTAPGTAGSGTTWLDGDLGYQIHVYGNTFREIRNRDGTALFDDGTLTGIFTGQSHEGAAGTLERSDLTAAFGASR